MNEPKFDPPKGPVEPVKLGLDDSIQFQCRKGIACFNQCCQNIDIMLTPYDILRLKNRLGLSSEEFIEKYTVPFEMDGHGMPGLKLKTREDSPACQFVTDEGCSVYEDRPAACRYYALGLMSMRKKDSPADEDSYFMVKEDHCLGHNEPRTLTVREYRQEQGVDIYDELNQEWRQIVLKKRSAGPTVGQPSERSFQLFFLASYNLDAFRRFVESDAFQQAYDVAPDLMKTLMDDEVELLKFGLRFLKQMLFDEKFIAEKPDALEKRLKSKREREARFKELEAGRQGT